MAGLPTGTVTFLFTDIEGSTTLLQGLGDRRYAEVLAEHQRLLRDAFAKGNGQEVDTQGDAFLVAFPRARDAVGAAVAAQRAVTKHAWPDGASLRVRMGMHTGEPLSESGSYVGLDVHRAARICSAGHGGQILLSQAVEILAAPDLPPGASLRDLGPHRLKDLKEPEHLFQVVHPDLPADFPRLKSLDVFPNNLPRQLTSFIGREREIAEIKQLLSTTCLLTLTGAGGSGKTRLALQVGADLLEQYPDGVWLVELAALADPALVPQTVAVALSVLEQPGRALTGTLVDSLRPKSLLLLFDNCEHLLAACAGLADALLRACPNLRILATSRESLGIAGETLYPVPTLPSPNPQRLPAMENLVQYESVRLLAERATAVLPTFRVTPQNARPVAQICHYLDGIPLAIELAAVRVKVLTVDQIAVRLDDRFRLLTAGSRTVLPRHQTLRAAMDWSYDLLSENDRILLRRLSVFAGGWTLEAAEAICTGNNLQTREVLELLTRLVDKSLVIVEPREGGQRYRLLETVRQYAREKLSGSRDEAAVLESHRDWYLNLAERMEEKRWGPDQAVALNDLENDHDNLSAALESSLKSGGAETGLRLAGALGWFWHIRGYQSEGRQRLKVASAVSESAPTPARAKVLFWAGRLALYQHDHSAARSLFDESLAIFRELGSDRDVAILLQDMGGAAYGEGRVDEVRRLYEESLAIFRRLKHEEGIGWSLRSLTSLAQGQGDYREARSLATEGLAILRRLGSKRGIAYMLMRLGGLARDQGDYVTARSIHEESLGILRELGDKQGIGLELGYLGKLAHIRGDYRVAQTLYEESVRILRELGSKRDMADVQAELGRLAYDQGDYTAAHPLYQESLSTLRELGHKPAFGWLLYFIGELAHVEGDYAGARSFLDESLKLSREIGAKRNIGWALRARADLARTQGDNAQAAALHKEALSLLGELEDKKGIAECLAGFAGVAFERKQWTRAAILYEAAKRLREAIGAPLTVPERSTYDRDESAVRGTIASITFDQARAEGRAMTLEQAIEYTLADPPG